MKAEGVTEERQNQMEWVRRVNNIPSFQLHHFMPNDVVELYIPEKTIL